MLYSCVDGSSVVPDFDHVDLNAKEPYIHALVLKELVRRTEGGEDLFEGLPQRIRAYSRAYDLRLMESDDLPF